MKVTREEKGFTKVSITLEDKDELYTLVASLGRAGLSDYGESIRLHGWGVDRYRIDYIGRKLYDQLKKEI